MSTVCWDRVTALNCYLSETAERQWGFGCKNLLELVVKDIGIVFALSIKLAIFAKGRQTSRVIFDLFNMV